jgi:transcriptional regulator with XRE-family HTH domain
MFAANVRRLRAIAGSTQEALAERVGLDLRYLQRVEAGEVDAKLSLLDRFALAFGVRHAALLAPARLPRPTKGRPRQSRRQPTRR